MQILLKAPKMSLVDIGNFEKTLYFRCFFDIFASIRHRTLKFSPDPHFDMENTNMKSIHAYILVEY
jgi:hypothetical protein